VTVILINFNATGVFLQLFEPAHISHSKKIRPVGAEFFHTDGQTWRS